MSFSFAAWQWVFVFLIAHVIIYGFYLFTSNGLAPKTIYLQSRRYIPCALVITFALYLWAKASLPLQFLAPYLLIFCAWLTVYPFTYWLAFHRNTTFIDNHYDAAVAAYFSSGLLALHLLLLQFFGDALWIAGFMAIIQLAALVLPIVGLVYFAVYRTPVSESACMALIQTDPREAQEFVAKEIGLGGILGTILGAVLLLSALFWLNLPHTDPASLTIGYKIFLSVLFISTTSYGIKAFSRSGAVWAYRQAVDYFNRSSLFTQFHQEVLAGLEVSGPEKHSAKPHTIVLVIGESASRYYMSAYRNTEHDTTPWMREKSAEENFILFRHAYTSWGQTVPSLERALTEKNQYNDKEFNRSITLIDLARKAGYTTHWYSNQGVISDADTPITLIGETADHYKWLQADIANTDGNMYDENLLATLKDVDSEKNNFIVFHIMGSHDNYINRYPESFTRWGTSGKFSLLDNYDNSLAYTDKLLEDIFTYAREHLNLQSMVYFADHGANPLKRRNPDISDFISMRIPLFLYLSPEYRSLYPETAQALRSHEHSYVTNDLVYDMMAGIMNLKSNHYDPANSIASSEYRFTRETLFTALGRIPLTDDTTESDE